MDNSPKGLGSMRTRISEEQTKAITAQMNELITNLSEKVDRAEECYETGTPESNVIIASGLVSRSKQRLLGFIDGCYIFGAFIEYELSNYGKHGLVKVSGWHFI